MSSSDFRNGSINWLLYQKSLEGTGTDLVFNVGPKAEKVHTHSLIVLESSAVFKAMLSGRWDQKKTEEGEVSVDLPVDAPADFKTFVKLMYGFSKFNVNDFKFVFPVYRMADKYEAPEVQQTLSDYSATLANRKLTITNVVEIYLSAKEYGVEGLKLAACEYMTINIIELWKNKAWLELDTDAMVYLVGNDTLCGLELRGISLQCVGNCCESRCNNSTCSRTNYHSENEKLILEKVLEWIKHKRATPTEDTKFASRVLRKIRFPLMTCQDFMVGMKNAQEGVLTDLELGEVLKLGLTSSHDGLTPMTSAVNSRISLKRPSLTGRCTSASFCRTFTYISGVYRCACCNS